MDTVDDRRDSMPPVREPMEHVDCLLVPRLDTGEGVSSMGTLLLALAIEEFCVADVRRHRHYMHHCELLVLMDRLKSG